MDRCIAVSLGTVDYLVAWKLQKRLHRKVAEGAIPGLLLLLEHPHVYTLGRRGKAEDILVSEVRLAELAAEVHQIDRGGEVTYHGPGQLVGYPIVDLRAWGGGPLRYVRTLEDALIATLAEFGIEVGRRDRPTGVWVGEAKVAAIGVKVGRGVTTHGFALNVGTDLSYFDHIVPCGTPGGPVASMSSLLDRRVAVQDVVGVLARRFGEAFGWKVEWAEIEALGLVSHTLS